MVSVSSFSPSLFCYPVFDVGNVPTGIIVLSTKKEIETLYWKCRRLFVPINNFFVITKHPGTSQTAIFGTSRSEDGDSSESAAENVNPCSFNLHRDYTKSLMLSNVGEP